MMKSHAWAIWAELLALGVCGCTVETAVTTSESSVDIAGAALTDSTVELDANATGARGGAVACFSKVCVALPDGGLTTEAGTSVRLVVSLSSQPEGVVTVTASSTDPTEGIALGTLVFDEENWRGPQAIIVTGQPDHRVDGDKHYAIRFVARAPADPAVDRIHVPPIQLVNRDDDTAGLVLVPRGPLATNEHGGQALVDVSLSSEPSANVAVKIVVTDSTEAVVSPVWMLFTRQTWAEAQPATLRGVGDLLADGVVPYDITFTVVSWDPAYAKLRPQKLSCENLDAAAFAGIGDLSGGDAESAALDVNGDGTVIVGFSVDDSGDQAVRFTPDSGLASLGGVSSRALGIDDSGNTIVGEARNSESRPQAAFWVGGAGPQLFEAPQIGPMAYVRASGVSGDGQLTVGTGEQVGGGAFGISWRSGQLENFGYPYAEKTAANEDGSVVVGYEFSHHYSGTSHALRNESELPMPQPCGQSFARCYGRAYDVSRDGAVVVGAVRTDGEGYYLATKWIVDPGGGVTIETLPLQQNAQALGVSGDGSVAVGFEANEQQNAIIWTDGTSRRLAALLTEAGVAMDGWTLTVARAASNDGRVVVGEGLNPSGNPEGWVAVLPAKPQP